MRLANQNGLLANFMQNFSLSAALRAVAVVFATWVWGGT